MHCVGFRRDPSPTHSNTSNVDSATVDVDLCSLRDKWRKYVHGVANPRIEEENRTDVSFWIIIDKKDPRKKQKQ